MSDLNNSLNHFGRARILLAGLAVILLVGLLPGSVFGGSPIRPGQILLKKTPPRTAYPNLRPTPTALSQITRRGLASSDNARGNISALLQGAVEEGRIGDIEKLTLQQRYSAIPGRGDFALLECLKADACDLGGFPALATQVGRNQLHLQHAARCNGCNKINVFKLSGNTVESLMHSFYQRGGWKQLEGEIGNSGIDGLYYKVNSSGQVVDVLVTEAKYNQSILQETRSGTQMSKQWILDNLSRLEDRAKQQGQPDRVQLYGQINRFVEKDVYRAQLWHMNVDADNLLIWRERVSSKGRAIDQMDPIAGEAPWNPGTVHAIDMLSPSSDFDRVILSDYISILSESSATVFY